LLTDDPAFRRLAQNRYGPYLSSATGAALTVELVRENELSAEQEDVSMRRSGGRWFAERGDFRLDWDALNDCGRVRQLPTVYALDTVLRALHTLLLAGQGGFL